MSFLHEEKSRSPDDVPVATAPHCERCGAETWLVKVEKTVSDSGARGTYTYECPTCRTRKTLRITAPGSSGPPIVPEI